MPQRPSPRSIRDEAADELEALRRGHAPLRRFYRQHALRLHRYGDRSTRRILRTLIETLQMQLPTRPGRWTDADAVAGVADELDRAALFLRTDRVYREPKPRITIVSATGITLFLVGLLSFVGFAATDPENGLFHAPGLEPVFRRTTLVAWGLLFVPLFGLHLLLDVLVAVHIFRVRVMRQELTPRPGPTPAPQADDPDSFWPFPDPETLRAAQQHLKQDVRRALAHHLQALPGVFGQEPHGHVEGRASPAFQRPVTNGVQLLGNRQHVIKTKASCE